MAPPVLHWLATSEYLLSKALAALSARESHVYAAFTNEKRRNDWLLGRLAAKQALAACVGASFADVEILSEPSGRPSPALAGAPVSGWDVSISHGHGQAVALAAPARVGVDVEKLRPLAPGAFKHFLSPGECAMLSSRPSPDAPIIAWALKEASFKASAAAETLKDVSLLFWEEGAALLAMGEERLWARYRCSQGFCLAVAVAAIEAPAWLDELAWPEFF